MTRAESYVEELRDYNQRALEVAAILWPDYKMGTDITAQAMMLMSLLMLIDVRGDLRIAKYQIMG